MALRGQTVQHEVVVADNSSEELTRNMLESDFPEVVRLGSGVNLGFGPSLNRAITTIGNGPIILLNDDTIPSPTFVSDLVDHSNTAPMVAGALVRDNDPATIDSAGISVDQTLMAFDYLTGLPVSVLKHADAPLGPTGGAALFNRDLFNEVGGFDENIFLYYEDVDLALRMRECGGHCELAPEALALHGYSTTLGAHSAEKFAFSGWSRGYLLRRYGVLNNSSPFGVMLREAAVCGGQIVGKGTVAGLLGRLRGWRAARDLPRRTLPKEYVETLSTREAVQRRYLGSKR